MTDHKQYLGDLIGGSLMIKDSQLIADLLLKDPSTKQWHDAIVEQNILQKQSVASAMRNASTIRKRLQGVDNKFLEKLSYSGTAEATQLIFAATLMNSAILADFMSSVISDAKRMYRESLNIDDWKHFWEERSRSYPSLTDMSDSSTYKISQLGMILFSFAISAIVFSFSNNSSTSLLLNSAE